MSPEYFAKQGLEMFMVVLECHCDWDVPLTCSGQIMGTLNVLR